MIQAKANQKNLINDIEEHFERQQANQKAKANQTKTTKTTKTTTTEKNKGRLETRICTIIPYNNQDWPSVKTIVKIETKVEINQAKSC